MRNGSLFWGFVLVLLGVLMLVGAMQYFWPVVLIVIGGWIVFSAFWRGAMGNQSVSVDAQGAASAYVKIGHGAGELRVDAAATSGKVLEGMVTEGARVDSRQTGDRLDVRLTNDVSFIPFAGNTRGLNWDLHLTRDIPLTLDLETGANRSIVDLREARVTSVTLITGASETEITLPATGQVTAAVHLGAAEARLNIPEGVAARIRSQSGLAEINVNTARFPQMGGVYQSADFETAANRVDLRIDAGVGKVSVR